MVEGVFPDTIVVPLDGSELAARAIPVARALVHQTGGRVILVRSCWPGDACEARAYLDEMATACADIDVSTVVIEDWPAPTAIRGVVREAPARMACMTTHGRGRMRWALLGGVAEDIVRKLSGSALLVGCHCRSQWPNNFRKMVVSVDGSSAARVVEPEAVEWATTLGLDVHVASVVHQLEKTDRMRCSMRSSAAWTLTGSTRTSACSETVIRRARSRISPKASTRI
jgi:nucleotide-binding universal stress UspA family protein